MIRYIRILRLVIRCLLVARKKNLTGVSTGLTGRSKNLDPTGPTGFHLCYDPHTFHCNNCFVFRGILVCLKVFSDTMLSWISSNSCPLNLLLVRCHQAEIINYRKASYPSAQQRGRGAGWTLIIRSGPSCDWVVRLFMQLATFNLRLNSSTELQRSDQTYVYEASIFVRNCDSVCWSRGNLPGYPCKWQSV